MKTKLFLVAALALASVSSYAQTESTLPMYEPFPYALGTILVPNTAVATGITTQTGNWFTFYQAVTGPTSDLSIVDTSAWSANGFPALSGKGVNFVGGSVDPCLKFTPQTGKVIYSSLQFKVNSNTAVTAGAMDYFYSLGKTASSGTSINYASLIYLKKITDTSFNIGIAENNSTSLITWVGGATPTAFTVGTQYSVVVSYDQPNSQSYIWVNPTINNVAIPAESANTASDTTTSARDLITFARIQKNSNASTADITVAEIRVGLSWNEVTGAAVPLAVSNTKANSSFSIYPNPAKNYFTVESKNNAPVSSISILSFDGKLVKSIANPKTKQVDISNLSKGVYLVKVMSNNVESTSKLIVN